MKPRLFIGSSSEGRAVAEAIHANLANNAECTTWSYGVFELARSTLQSLQDQLRTSDFGVFVFSADDVINLFGSNSPPLAA
jgi:predicted nucleotide-binding protein